MPSTNQTGRKSDADFDSDEKKMLATKNDLTIAALLRGIRDPERAQAYIDAEVELAAEEDRDVRKSIIGACNRKKTALEGRDTPDTPVDDDATDTPDPDEDDDTAAHGGQDGDDSPDADFDAPVFDSREALETAVDDHEHDDVATVAKPDGTKAACFTCESHIGVVPRDD